jgi:hypothetical protein
MPEKDAVIAITAETPDMQSEINLVWKYLLPAMKDGAFTEPKTDSKALKKKLASLSLQPPSASKSSPMEKTIEGKTFAVAPNEKHIQNIAFQFSNGTCYTTIKTDTATYKIGFASGKWQPGETTMHGPYLVERAKSNLEGLPPFKIDGSYTWTDNNTLKLVLRYIESPHTETLICHFFDNQLSINVSNSFDYGKREVALKGVENR